MAETVSREAKVQIETVLPVATPAAKTDQQQLPEKPAAVNSQNPVTATVPNSKRLF